MEEGLGTGFWARFFVSLFLQSAYEVLPAYARPFFFLKKKRFNFKKKILLHGCFLKK